MPYRIQLPPLRVWIYWIVSLPTHFQIHWFIMSLLVAMVSCLSGNFILTLLASILAIWTGRNLAPYVNPRLKIAPKQHQDSALLSHRQTGAISNSQRGENKVPVKVLHANVLIESKSHAAVRELIMTQEPDFVSLDECTEEWLLELLQSNDLASRYPYRHSENNYFLFFKPHSVTLLSKYPFLRLRTVYGKPDQQQDATIIAEVEIGGEPLVVIIAHPRVPLSPIYFNRQIRHFKQMASLDLKDKHAILMGDMNTTPWLPTFQQMVKALRLRDIRLDAGALANTWPAPLTAIGIPIDFILVSEKIQLDSFHCGPFVGSDHLPLIAQLFIQTGSTQPE